MSQQPITISEHATSSANHRTFTVNFFSTPITVTVTSTPSVVRRWIRTTLHKNCRHVNQLVVGLGVQWTPTFSDSPAHTLQLCVGRRCLVFQLAHCDAVPRNLRRFLRHPKNTFVGVWNGQGVEKLWRSGHVLEVDRVLDVRRFAETESGERLLTASFERIVEECLGYEGVRLERWISMSDWDDYVLSYEQVLQAQGFFSDWQGFKGLGDLVSGELLFLNVLFHWMQCNATLLTCCDVYICLYPFEV